VGTNIIGSDPNATANVASGFDYRAFSAIQGVNYGDGRKLQAGYNQRRSQLASLRVKRADGTDPIINNEYDYHLGGANNGRIQKITDYLDGNYTTTYGYDEHNRLATASAPSFSRSYAYDAWGNLTNHTASGQGETGSYSLSYATNASGATLNNQINSAGYGYDAAGNLTTERATSYTYDAANRLKTAGWLNNYEYDGDGNKVKQSNGDTIYYLWSSLLGEPVAELTSGGVYRAYVYGPGGGQVVAMRSYDGGFYWLHTDHLGSGRKMTDTSGALIYRGEFDPHGQSLYEWQVTGQTNLNSHKFTGYERDFGTNLDYAKARIYHHNRGRFMQPDPLGFGSADVTNPQSLNLYSYVRNDPVNFVDPSGLRMSLGPHPGLGSLDGNVVIVGLWNEIKDGDMVIDYKFIGQMAIFGSSMLAGGVDDLGGGGQGVTGELPKTPCPPTAQELINNPAVRKALNAAMAKSGSFDPSRKNPGNPDKVHEEGGWIYWNSKTNKIAIRFGPPGKTMREAGDISKLEINLDNPPNLGGNWMLVADFHTHPLLNWDLRNGNDHSVALNNGVPFIVKQGKDVGYVGPDRAGSNPIDARSPRPGYPGKTLDTRHCK
jgi:RHS repeat-associated protein